MLHDEESIVESRYTPPSENSGLNMRHPTLRGLLLVIERCLKLRDLGLFVDAKSVPSLSGAKSSICSRAVTRPFLADSPLQLSEVVAFMNVSALEAGQFTLSLALVPSYAKPYDVLSFGPLKVRNENPIVGPRFARERRRKTIHSHIARPGCSRLANQWRYIKVLPWGFTHPTVGSRKSCTISTSALSGS